MDEKPSIMVVLVLVVVLAAGGSPLPVGAQQVNRVALIVDFGDHQVTRCVEFGESEISGYDVLLRAGFDVVPTFDAGMGAGVCSINDVGCPAGDCFCECTGSPCVYWAYHHLVGGQWQYSGLGASSHMARSGDVEGWAWGEGGLTDGAQPAVVSFDQICAPPPTDTPVPTNTSIPVTDTPLPPTDTPPPPAPEVWFRLDENPVAAGACTFVHWDTSNGLEVFLDGEIVDANGGRKVCPAASQTYKLRVVGVDTESAHELVLGVTGVATSSPTPASLALVPTLPPPTVAPSTGVEPVGVNSSPSPNSPPASTPVPTPTPPDVEVAPNPTATPAPPPPAAPSLSPTHVALPAPSPVPTYLPAASTGKTSTSPLVPLGYVVFSLLAGSLLGWLVFEIRRRR